jgi:hypothetical protein
LEIAIAHHEEAERQNKEFNAVLRGARQAGWLSFRPDLEGKLVSCDREKWCRTLIEGTDRLPKHPFFTDRGMWIVQGAVEDMTPEQAQEAAAKAFQPEIAEVHERQAAGVVLDFQGSEANRADASVTSVAASVLELCQGEEDKEYLKDILVAQRRREQFQARVAKIAAAPSQIKRRISKKTSEKQALKLSLKEKRKLWKKKQGTKTPEQAAAQVVLSVGKKGKGSFAANLGQKLKKKREASKKTETAKPKPEEKSTKKSEKKKEETKKAVGEEKELQKDHFMIGKMVRLVGDEQDKSDEIVTITGVQTDEKGQIVYVRWWQHGKGCSGRARLDELAFQDKKYTKPFSPNTANLVRLRDDERADICIGQNELQLLKVISSSSNSSSNSHSSSNSN